MTTGQEHYETHPGRIYSWMVGDIDAALAKSAAELDALHLPKTRGAAALDLGAGFGLHALPLAQCGYAVTAIDSCQPLLDELRARALGLPITTIHADIAAFGAQVKQPLDVILCMGDTLTHLPDLAAVESLFCASGCRIDEGWNVCRDVSRLCFSAACGRAALHCRAQRRAAHPQLLSRVRSSAGAGLRPSARARRRGLAAAGKQLPEAAP